MKAKSGLVAVGVSCAMALALVACGKKDKTKTVYREGEPPVRFVAPDDPEMEAAIQKAKDTLDDFIAEMKSPRDRWFCVKSGFKTDSGKTEHMWVSNVIYAAGKFKGKLENNPLDIKSLKAGDPVVVDREDVSDWIIMDGDKMLGGYTAKLLMERENNK